jgi:transposase
MDRARYAVDAVVVEGRSFREVASSLGVSKSWVGKQVSRFRAGGYEALVAFIYGSSQTPDTDASRARRRDRADAQAPR